MAFQNDDKLTKFYTGLPKYGLAKAVFDLVKDLVPYSSRNTLPQFDEFIVMLLRLRLNATQQDLAYRFNASESTVSWIIVKWIDGLYVRL